MVKSLFLLDIQGLSIHEVRSSFHGLTSLLGYLQIDYFVDCPILDMSFLLFSRKRILHISLRFSLDHWAMSLM